MFVKIFHIAYESGNIGHIMMLLYPTITVDLQVDKITYQSFTGLPKNLRGKIEYTQIHLHTMKIILMIYQLQLLIIINILII